MPAWRGWGDAIPGPTHAALLDHVISIAADERLRVRPATHPFWTVTSKTDIWLIDVAKRRRTRWATPDDMAALQGFPVGWHFPGGQGRKRSAIGDAVPLAMGRAVARAVRARLELP